MNDYFYECEELYRAVYPPSIMPMFWKENGELSSAVFKDKKGLSVERSGKRDEADAIKALRKSFVGLIVSVYVRNCFACGAIVRYLPTQRSKYHSEIHGSVDRKLLNQSQCKYLANMAKIYVEES